MTAILIGCGAAKRESGRWAARELYTGSLFVASRRYAEGDGRPWFIVSALYELVHPDAELEPYNVAVQQFDREDREQWGRRVVARLHANCPGVRAVELHMGAVYVGALAPWLQATGVQVWDALEREPIGRRLQWYASQRGPVQLGLGFAAGA